MSPQRAAREPTALARRTTSAPSERAYSRKVADLATEAIESSAHATFLGGTTDSGSHCGPVGLTDSLPGDTSYKVDLGQSAKSPEEFQERPITIITDEGRYILVDQQMQGS